MNAIKAIWTNGNIVPAEPVDWPEGTQLLVEVVVPSAKIGREESSEGQLSLGQRIAARARALPQEILDRLPADGASQHDSYIYGTPKRPE
jgi:hypothetical protein